MKITVPTYPTKLFRHLSDFKYAVERIKHMYHDEKLYDYIQGHNTTKGFDKLIQADPTYQEIIQAYKDLTQLRLKMMRHRRKREHVEYPVSDLAQKWILWYRENIKEINYRYGRPIEEETEDEETQDC